jgi:diguanylate cyclase (GGDEF)-like protein
MTDVPPDLRATLERLSGLIDTHLDWHGRWIRSLFFPATSPKAPLPDGFVEWAQAPDRHPIADQPAVERVAALHADVHARALALSLHAGSGRPPREAEFAEATIRFNEMIAQMRRLERALSLGLYGIDPQTGLRSRFGLRDDMVARLAGFERGDPAFSIVIGDVDRMRKLNGRHGQAGGDRILRAAALALGRHFGPDDEGYRAGDDAILVFLSGARLADAARRAERMRNEVVATPVALPSGHVARMTMSFGVIEAVKGLSVDDLLLGAETAMREAKSTGRNRVVRARLADAGDTEAVGPTG